MAEKKKENLERRETLYKQKIKRARRLICILKYLDQMDNVKKKKKIEIGHKTKNTLYF